MEERRKFMRFPAILDVIYRIPERPIDSKCISKDFSREGIGFSVNEWLVPGTVLDLQIDIADDDIAVFARGKVIWLESTGQGSRFDTGIEFGYIWRLDRARIFEYVYGQWRKNLPVK